MQEILNNIPRGAYKEAEIIGDCLLICGDCLEVMKWLPRMDHVICDPPYEDELHGAVGKFAKLRNDGKNYASNKISSFGFDGINAKRGAVAAACVDSSNGWVMLFSLAEGVRAWRDEIQAAGGKYDTCLAWVKPDSAPRFNGQGAARGFECVITAWAGRGHRSWNAGGKRGVYTHCVNGPDREGSHPTEKPIRLMAEILNDFTLPRQTILDPFSGSFTTGVACVKLGRKFIGVELEPKYYEIGKKRIAKAYSQPDMFINPPPKPVQESML